MFPARHFVLGLQMYYKNSYAQIFWDIFMKISQASLCWPDIWEEIPVRLGFFVLTHDFRHFLHRWNPLRSHPPFVLTRNHESLPPRILESDAGNRCRNAAAGGPFVVAATEIGIGFGLSLLLSFSIPAAIPKSWPEIKNHCSPEAVSWAKRAAIPKFTHSNPESLHAGGHFWGKRCSDS